MATACQVQVITSEVVDMFKSKDFVAFVESMVGMPYWYGTCVYKCSSSLLKSKSNQYPSHYTDSRMSKYNDAIAKKRVCADCVGLIKGYFWTNGGEGVHDYIMGTGDFSNKYNTNGCPDKSADGMFSWCKSKGAKYGAIASLPEVPGVLLFSSGHVGVYVGGGYAVEARGFNYGVVKTKVASRTWKNWAYLPDSLLDYSNSDNVVEPIKEPEKVVEVVEKPTTYKLGERNLSKGCKGEDVKELQKALIAVGASLTRYGADGDFGDETRTAVKWFQTKYNLSVDGIYGKKSHAKMNEVLSSLEKAENFKAVVTSRSVNVRTAPNKTTGKIKYVVHCNDILDVQDVDELTGWYHLTDGNYICSDYLKRL